MSNPPSRRQRSLMLRKIAVTDGDLINRVDLVLWWAVPPWRAKVRMPTGRLSELCDEIRTQVQNEALATSWEVRS